MPTYYAFLRWLLRHLDAAPTLIRLADSIFDAGTLAERWELLKSLGDALIPIIEDFPADEEASFDTLATNECEAQAVIALKIGDGQRLRKLWPLIEMLLPILLPIFLKKNAA